MKSGKIQFYTGLALILIIIILVGLAPLVTDYDPLGINQGARFEDPSRDHLMGTDHFGRDIFTRILYGGRITLPAAFLTLFATNIIGVFIGILAAFNQGKWLDNLIMRIVDILLAVPFVVIAMAVTTFFGRGLKQLLLIIICVWWANFARFTRSISLPILRQTYVEASIISGASQVRIAIKDILPAIVGQIVVQFTFQLSNTILQLSVLSFFGLGSKPPNPEWGSMLADSRQYMATEPGLLIWTSLAIFLVVFACNLIGEGLKSILYPSNIPRQWRLMRLG